jgi:uncharacterized membrane protein YdjX (TVP38/TMEM64 family)
LNARLLMQRHGRLAAVLAFLVLLWIGFSLLGLDAHFEPQAIRRNILMHPLLGALLFIGLFALGNLLQIPGWIFLASAVFALGAFWGGVITYLAAAVSCAVTFLVIRAIGSNALREFDHPRAKRIFQRLDAAPVRSVATLRLIFQTMPALNVALALSGIGFRDYLAGTLLGLPLPILAYCLFFEQIASALGIH